MGGGGEGERKEKGEIGGEREGGGRKKEVHKIWHQINRKNRKVTDIFMHTRKS